MADDLPKQKVRPQKNLSLQKKLLNFQGVN